MAGGIPVVGIVVRVLSAAVPAASPPSSQDPQELQEVATASVGSRGNIKYIQTIKSIFFKKCLTLGLNI